MTQDQVALCEREPAHLWEPARPIVPVLIRVPALSAPSRRRRFPARAAVRRRRRLRREVRLAGLAFLLVVLPLTWAILMLGGPEADPPMVSARLTGIEVVGPAIASADEPARATEPVAAAVPSPPRTTRSPVVLPGYVLPDDGSEEPAHAGS